MQHAAEHFRRERGEAGEARGQILGQRIADAKRAVVRNADNIARDSVVGDVAVLAEEEHRAVDRERLAGSHLRQLHAAAELSGAEPHEGDPVAMVRIHVRLHFEHEAGDVVAAWCRPRRRMSGCGRGGGACSAISRSSSSTE